MPKAFKKSKELYIYPAIFSYDNDGISIEFPDLPGCLSCASDDKEAVYNAKEVLALYLYEMESNDENIPIASDASEITVNKNQKIFFIDVWMPYHRAKIKTHYVKKTLTIPNWLNELAEYNNVNFSKLLRKSLLEYLGVNDIED